MELRNKIIDNNEVFIIKSYNTLLSNKKLLNAIMDEDNNVICWNNYKNAKKYLSNHGIGNKFKVEKKNIKTLNDEIELLKKKTKLNFKLKIIKTVEYERSCL